MRGSCDASGMAWIVRFPARMIDRLLSGQRCRALKTLPHPRSPILRHREGSVRYGMENVGRTLLMVDWDDGMATLVFPTDIEIVHPPQ